MQILKDDIRDRIINAALEKFSDRGFAQTSMADIAKKAGLSVGNLYLYYKNKDELFHSIIPQSLVEELKSQLMKRISFADGLELSQIRENPAYMFIGKEMIEFYCKYRLQILIILGKSENTPYAGLKEEVIQYLANLFFQYADSIQNVGDQHDMEVLQEVIPIIYASLIFSLLSILKTNSSKEQLRLKIKKLISYHLFGLNDILE
jgi:AcrR family transcriptional regulator